VDNIGLGVKKSRAAIAYEFTMLCFASGEIRPLQTRLIRVDSARETVDDAGIVRGIRFNANVSSTLATYAWRLLLIEPTVGLPVMATKIFLAPSPDPEIYYPPGTELLVRLTAPLALPESSSRQEPLLALTGVESDGIRSSLAALSSHVVRNSKGKPTDLVNLVFVGNRQEIETAFLTARWSGTDKRNVHALVKTYFAMIQRRSYPNAPMCPLRLDGRMPDLEFQKGLNTFARRHHVRIWQAGEFHDGTPIWVGSATEDVDIKFSWNSGRFTHTIDPRIDGERAKVVNDLIGVECVGAASMVDGGSPDRADSIPHIETDGRLGAVRLRSCSPDLETGHLTKKPSYMVMLRDDMVRTNFVSLGAGAVRLGGLAKSWLTRTMPDVLAPAERQSSFAFVPKTPAIPAVATVAGQ
jgi:hypothetical protein